MGLSPAVYKLQQQCSHPSSLLLLYIVFSWLLVDYLSLFLESRFAFFLCSERSWKNFCAVSWCVWQGLPTNSYINLRSVSLKKKFVTCLSKSRSSDPLLLQSCRLCPRRCRSFVMCRIKKYDVICIQVPSTIFRNSGTILDIYLKNKCHWNMCVCVCVY